MESMVVGIVGLGAVGGTVASTFTEVGVATRRYDRYLGVGAAADLGPCEVTFLCVPTPSREDGGLDLTEVWSAVHDVGVHLNTGAIVTIKSTVPPGTCDALADAFPRLRFASVPEFLVATQPVETFVRPDRIVIGSESPDVARLLGDLLSRVAPAAPIVVVSPAEAELVKLSSNAMLAAKVTMANELAEVSRRFGIAWPRVQAIVGLDRRIGPSHLSVTRERGFGGECLPKDLAGLINASQKAGYDPPVLNQIVAFNSEIRRRNPDEGMTEADASATMAGPATVE
jgi:UDPglucose 6-dehydrogenase